MRAMSAVLLSEEATERWNMSTSKTKKKLILNKQGIRQLTASDLAAAKGGESEGPCTYGFCQSAGCGGNYSAPASPRGGTLSSTPAGISGWFPFSAAVQPRP